MALTAVWYYVCGAPQVYASVSVHPDLTDVPGLNCFRLVRQDTGAEVPINGTTGEVGRASAMQHLCMCVRARCWRGAAVHHGVWNADLHRGLVLVLVVRRLASPRGPSWSWCGSLLRLPLTSSCY